MTAAAASNRVRNRAMLGGGAVLLIGVIAFMALKGPAAPEPSPTPGLAAADPPGTPLVVSLNRAGSGSAHVGFPESVTVSALGLAGIAGVELWAGPDLVAQEATDDPQRPAASIPLEWIPGATGETILLARAYDAEGRTGESSVLRLSVDDQAPLMVRVIEVIGAAGETLAQVVAAHGGDTSLAEAWNPELSPSEPFEAPTNVTVPVSGEAPVARQPGSADLASSRIMAAVTLPAGLSAPEPTVTVDACKLQISAQDSSTAEGGYLVQVLPPGSLSFLNVAALAPSTGIVSTETQALAGTNYVTVSAYDGQVLAPSAIVPAVVPDECHDGWEGDARLAGTELVLGAPVDRAYFYLSIDGGAWQRVPNNPGTFIEPVGGKLDAAGLLPPIGAEPLRLEAWGWRDGALVSRGKGTYAPPGGQQLYSGALPGSSQFALGFGTSLDIVLIKGYVVDDPQSELLGKSGSVDRPGPGSTAASRTFRWSTSVPGVTHVLWQITPYPLGKGTTLTPPFLIDSDTFVPTDPSGGTFTIDFKPYLTDASKVGIADVNSWANEQVVTEVVQAPILPGMATPAPTPASGAVEPVLVGLGGPFVPAAGASVGDAALGDLALLTPPLNVLYVRIIPMIGQTPAGSASNSVYFDIVEPGEPFYIDTSPPPPPPTYTNAYQMSATFYAPTGAIAKYSRCVRVVTAPQKIYAQMFINDPDWSVGTVHCYVEPDDSGFDLLDAFEAFTEWVGTAWDYISTGYAWMQDQLVNVVLTFVPCEQIANEISDNGKESCKAIAKTALQVVATAYGVPPEIPDWDSTMKALKGDVAEFVVEQASAEFPLVAQACSAAAATGGSVPSCEELVGKIIDEAVNKIMAKRSEAAAKSAGVAIPYGAIVEPDPRGFAQPPHFSVTMTRTNAPLPANVSCKVTGHMSSTVTGWSWLEYKWVGGDPTTVQKSGTVSGEPFLSNSVGFATLQPGESTSFEVWMTKPATWFEPDGWNDHYAQQYAEWNGQFNHAWALLQKGASVTGSLSSNCAPGGSGTETLSGNAWQ